jgi:hypothetical protein
MLVGRLPAAHQANEEVTEVLFLWFWIVEKSFYFSVYAPTEYNMNIESNRELSVFLLNMVYRVHNVILLDSLLSSFLKNRVEKLLTRPSRISF